MDTRPKGGGGRLWRRSGPPRGVTRSAPSRQPRARGPYLVTVQAAGGRELPALLLRGPEVLGIRLVSAGSLAGHKARVVAPHPEGGPLAAWDVRVVWAVRLAEGLFENGAEILDPGGEAP